MTYYLFVVTKYPDRRWTIEKIDEQFAYRYRYIFTNYWKAWAECLKRNSNDDL